MNYADLTHITGPAIVTWNGTTWYTEGDIDVDIVQETFDISTSRFGVIARRIKSLPVATISFKPDGQVTSGRATAAFPYTAASVGTSIFTAADLPCDIKTLAGKKYTFARAGWAGSPGMNLSAVNTAWDGTVQIKAIHSQAGEPTTASNFLAVATEALTDTSFAATNVITPGFTAAFGADPLDKMESLDGFAISCPCSVTEKSVDRFGVVDILVTSVGPATCEFTPAGLSEANWITLCDWDGATVRMPGQASSGGTDLVITGTGLAVTLAKCQIAGGGLGFGATKERLGRLRFFNSTVFTTGAPALPVTIAVS